jgi:magnesium transporter
VKPLADVPIHSPTHFTHPHSQINTSNLERVRRIKNRMVRLTTRVETLREVLEKFLDDDSDMKDLNLTAKVC